MFWSIVRELGLVLGGTGILVAALAWLSRSLLKLWLSKDLETHKSKLAAQSAVEFERLRSALEIQVLEHGV